MYRCPSCRVPISWWRGLGSSPETPHLCRNCGTESQEPDRRSRLKSLMLGALLLGTGILSIGFSTFLMFRDMRLCCASRPPLSEALVQMSPFLTWFALCSILQAREWIAAVRHGALVRISPEQKRRARIQWGLQMLSLSTLFVAFLIWKHWK
jgi:hypothetical protein